MDGNVVYLGGALEMYIARSHRPVCPRLHNVLLELIERPTKVETSMSVQNRIDNPYF